VARARGGHRVGRAAGVRRQRRPRRHGIRGGSAPADAGPCDLWVVATKAADVEAVTAAVAPLLRPDDLVMAFQNGLGAGDRVARHVPKEQVVVGIAEGFGSSIPAPGHVHHEGMRLIRIGEHLGGLTERVQRLEGAWREAGFNVAAFGDIDRMVWEKFLCNVTLSAPTAAFDVTVGELQADPEAWAVALGCMREAHALAVLLGVELSFDDPARYVTEFAATIPDASPSMRLDHLARRPSEVDVINGAVVDLSRQHGRTAPYNQSLCAILRGRERRFA
jgi:2-dehydropantoate 2-reductase